MAAMEDNFPSELNERLTAFDDALTNVDSVLQTLHEIPLSEVHEKVDMCTQRKSRKINDKTGWTVSDNR